MKPKTHVEWGSSLTAKAYDLLRHEIINCVLEPGQQIVQAQLAQHHGMGLTPIREALQRLAHEGFLQVIPRYGYIVSPITVSDVREIYEVRTILETASVRQAAVNALEKQLNSLYQSAHFTYLYKDRQSYTDFLAQNAEFHRSVALAAGNRRLLDLISRTLDELTRVFHLGLDLRDSAEEMRDEHIALAKALLDRDPERAARIVGGQIARSEQRVLEALVQQPTCVSPDKPILADRRLWR
jgi:DNA-binding GntR family transcriptional regulator